ncbi:hypothetical protein Q5424_26525 [Conexibacter sp. JD483]|uniref:hypothetical protein n=1 Tax=unclassified Conexibacter TaxID=2627773 RepID=UPI00271C1CCD|nr:MULTISPECIES: hypothetical protein [unclassified Conexibacter]MDO8188684.1 hypothetical protein [Conexibacter sp. CPCC 205706]MDO8201550.1 hypothetical protein [Conexibacter sp. CPCC 205762]MDR9372684.1 hypothetical protein [Conexibacter sp. JD483]
MQTPLSRSLAALTAAGLLAAVAAAPAGASTAWVTGGPSSSLVIPTDLSTGLVGTPIAVGTGAARAIVPSPDGSKLYVVTDQLGVTPYVAIVDTATRTVSTTYSNAALTSINGAQLTPDGRTLLVAAGSNLLPVDVSGTTPVFGTPIPAGGALSGSIAASADSRTAWFVAGGALRRADLATGAVSADLTFTGSPGQLAMSPDGATLYVTQSSADPWTDPVGIVPIDTATGTPGAVIGIGNVSRSVAPLNLVISRDGRQLHALLGQYVDPNQVITVDLATRTVKTTELGRSSNVRGIALAPRGKLAAVGGFGTGTLVSVDLPTQTLRPAVNVARGISGTVNPQFVAITGSADANGAAVPTITLDKASQSGVIGDPTNPTVTVTVGQSDQYGDPATPGEIAVTASSSSTSILPNAGIRIEGTGATRTVSFEPTGRGYASVTLTATGLDGKTRTVVLSYGASNATTPTSRVLQGGGDASTAIGVGRGHILVADDEQDIVRLFRTDRSGEAVKEFNIGPSADGGGEIDFESSARVGNTAYWFGSHGNRKAGQIETSRYTMIETRVVGSGADTTVTRVGQAYGGLRADLVAWDVANGNRLGFQAGTASGVRPDDANGFNLEGAEFAPGSSSTLYLGFRSPNLTTPNGLRAVIVPLLNADLLTKGDGTRAVFDEPILLDLGGMTIRELRKNAADQYLILAAKRNDTTGRVEESLFSWTGRRDDRPIALSTVLPPSAEVFSDGQGTWEGIGEMPATLAPGAELKLVMDQGYDRLYTSTDNKDLGDPRLKKSRLDTFTLTGRVGAQADTTTPTFAAQAAGTIGAAQTVTVTNGGAQLLKIGEVNVDAADAGSTGEFIVADDRCRGRVLGPDGTCTLLVRYAPARASATSTATLRLETNTGSGSATVALSGTSTELASGPKGDKGDPGDRGATGDRGAQGDTGAKGDTGNPGAKGDTGSAGAKGDTGANGRDGATGAKGDKGDAGANGKDGAAGSKGDKGDRGDQGPAGRDGTIELLSGQSRTSVKRGRTAQIAFSVRNLTSGALARATATVRAPRALRAGAVKTIRISGVGAGRSRTLKVTLKVGAKAAIGSHRVVVRLTVGGRQVSRTVTVKVTR